MDKYPGSLCRYFALTRDSAKDIMWPILEEMDERLGWKAVFTESNLTMTLPNNSRLRLYGADMRNFRRRVRGAKAPGNAVDECQEFASDDLEDLVDNIIKPSTADYTDGWVALGGTPGPIPRGYFYEVTKEGKHGYSNHCWSLFDNPFMPDPRGFVERLKTKKQWPENHPTLLREYKGQWVLDLESLLIKYTEEKNHYDILPTARWNYIMGIDLGIRDSDAIAILGWHDNSPDIYLVAEEITKGQDISSLVEQINRLSKLYDISKYVIDGGGLGAKIAEEIRRRHHIPVHASDKTRKFETVTFFNDWLRLGRFKAKKDSRFASDSYQLEIDYEKSTPERLVVKKSFHSDIIDAVIYAFKESPAFTYQVPKVVPAFGSKEWAAEQVDEMEEALINRLEEEEKLTDPWGMYR